MHNTNQSQTNNKTNVPGCSNPDLYETLKSLGDALNALLDYAESGSCQTGAIDAVITQGRAELTKSNKIIKGFLIDPFQRTVTEVFLTGELEEIYRLIDVDLFTVAPLGGAGDGVYVDDEGLFRQGQCFFRMDGYPQPLAGKGLVLGCDAHGKSTTPQITFEAVKAAVYWVRPLSRELWMDLETSAMFKTENHWD